MTDRKPLAERKAEAFALRKAGASPGAIAKKLSFKDAAAVDRIVAEALERDMPRDAALRWQDLELARIDDMQMRLTQRFQNGERGMERELMKLMDYRIRLLSSRANGAGKMYDAVVATIADLNLGKADDAAKQSALAMATMIDVCLSMGTADDHRRAINAMATMRNLLADLGANPAARDELDGIVTSSAASRSSAPVPEDEGSVTGGAEVLSFMERAQRFHKGTA